jgi:hypothetical protein
MSLKFEIADWEVELTWSEMVCTPLDQNGAKAKAKPQQNGSHRSQNSVGVAGRDAHRSLKLTQTKKRRGIQNEFS